MTTSIFFDIQKALTNNQPFAIEENKEGEPFVKTRGFWNRLIYCINSSYHTERIGRIAKILSKALKGVPRISAREGVSHEVIQIARAFFKRIDSKYLENPKVRKCFQNLLAAKLGIDKKLLDQNEGFEQFAIDSHLEKYLFEYQHELKVPAGTQEIHILYEGEYQPWSVVHKKLQALEEPKPNFFENPKQPWLYGQNGVQKKDFYAWTKLEPYKVGEDHDWGNRYIFEYCVCCGDRVRMNGDHTWLRLKTPQGEIYSVGIYRPRKTRFFENFLFPMRVKKGFFMLPDLSEFWPMPVSRLSFAISPEQFELIKKSIEQDKENEEEHSFQLFNGNCTEYVNSKAVLVGICLPTAIHLFRYVMPIFLQKAADWIMPRLSKIIRKVCIVFITFLTNLLQLALGAAMIDSSVKQKKISKKHTHLSSIVDLFNPEKLKFHPPRYLALSVFKEIEAWRDQEIKKAYEEGREVDAENIRFALPDKYRLG